MKKILAIAAVMAVALSAAAQGTIDFRNRVSGSVNAPIFDVGGGALATSGIVAELYWSATPTGTFAAAQALGGTAATPVTVSGSGATAGYWTANGDRLVGVAKGVNVSLQVRAWDSSAGSFALAQSTGKKFGQSAIFTIPAGDPGDPNAQPPTVAAPALMTGLTSFNLQVPEPSTIALGLLGAGALLLRRRK